MTKTTLTPLYRCSSLPLLGGFSRLRIAYSKDVLQQELQTETDLEQIIFVCFENWLADFNYVDDFSGDFQIDASLTDFGVDEKYTFRSIHDVDADPKEFTAWYHKKIKGRRFALEITNNNGFVRCINPFYITYKYIGSVGFDLLNRYELIYSRTRLVNSVVTTLRVIESISSIARMYLGRKSNDITINVFSNITVALFNYGYSLQNDITTVIYQNDPTSNILINIVDGTYYFYAVHRSSSIFDVIKATITAGEITIIEEENSQIITENETDDFQGNFVTQ